MSPPHVEAVRSIYEGWARGDFRAEERLLDPGFVFVLRPEFPDAGTYVGLAELRDYMRGFLEPWRRLTIEAEELVDAGDRVFAAVLQCGTGDGSGIPTELRYFQVWTFRGERAVRLENVRERADALAAAGLVG